MCQLGWRGWEKLEDVKDIQVASIMYRLKDIVDFTNENTPSYVVRGELLKIVKKTCSTCGGRMYLHDVDHGDKDLCYICSRKAFREEISNETADY